MNTNKVLSIDKLHTYFHTEIGTVQAVRGISLDIEEGGVLGLVGESGSGKTVTALSIMGLITSPGRIESGSIQLDRCELTTMNEKQLSDFRGKKVAMVFQEPLAGMNPVFNIGSMIKDIVTRHLKVDRKQAGKIAYEKLKLVGFPDPDFGLKAYPYELSGGMRQRAMLAMALSCEPDLLILDEPTTSLDVTIQAQILSLLRELNEETGTSMLIISHDLGVIVETCEDVAIMYGGKIMEKGPVSEVLTDPKHPYTRGLIETVRSIDEEKESDLKVIQGQPLELMGPHEGCPFASRCGYTMKVCLNEEVTMFDAGPDHQSACWLLHDEAPKVADYKG